MDNHREAALRCRDAVFLSYQAEMIGARLQMAERDFVDTRLHAHPFLFVDAVSVDDMLWIIVGQRRQLYGKGVVTRTEHETVRGDDGSVCHLPETRHGCWCHGLSVDGKSRQLDLRLPVADLDFLGVKPGDAAQSAKHQFAVGSAP